MNKEFLKKRKIIAVMLILVALVIIIVMAVSILGKRNKVSGTNNVATSNEVNVYTSKESATGKKSGNVLLEKTKIVYENGTSKITTKVTNNGSSKEDLKFTVKFLANDGSVIAKAIGHVGAIKENETKYVDSSVNVDVSNAKKIVYGIKE